MRTYRREAVVWIAPTDEKNEADVLGAANAAALRLELIIVETIRDREDLVVLRPL